MHDALIWAEILFDPNDLIEIRPLQPWQGRRDWVKAKDLSQHIDRMGSENDKGANLFIGVMPRTEAGGGAAEHVKHGHVIWADFDHCDPHAAVDIVKKMGLPDPSMVTATGHGAHVFWRLDKPHSKEDIVDLVGRFVNRFLRDPEASKHVDKSAKDAARILRVPGFINRKPPVARASILFANKNRYDIDELRKHAPSEEEERQRDETEQKKREAVRIETNHDEARRAASYISKIEGSGTGGRTTKAFQVACTLVADFAIDDGTALQLLRDWDSQANTPPIQGDNTYPDNELEKILANAHKYHKGQVGSKVKTDECSNGVVDGVDLSGILAMRRPEPLDLPALPERFFDVPGFIGDVMAYNLRTAPKPQPVLALAGAIALQAVLCARKITSEDGDMVNVYICCVADSGTGKEHARQVTKVILQKADAIDLQAEGIKSGAALVSKLQRTPACLFQLDEFGLLMQNISMAKSTPHLHDITAKMLSLYSSSKTLFKAAEAANADDGGQEIYKPHAIIYGTTVPGELYNGLTIESVANGFLGRMIIFDIEGNDPVRKRQSWEEPNPQLIADARAWVEMGGGNIESVAPNPIMRVVPISSGAQKIMDEFCEKEHRERKQMGDDVRGTLWTRTAENANKLALIYAASKYTRNIEEIQIDEEGTQWAYDMCEFLTRRMIASIGDNVAENPFHSDMLRLKRHMTNGMARYPEGVPKTYLYRKMKMKSRLLDEIIETACRSDYVSQVKEQTPGAPAYKYKWTGP